MNLHGPVGVFDSGLGGVSVLHEMRRLLPQETFCYIGDTAQVPWGGRAPEQIRAFSAAITRYLTVTLACRAVVVACNTATSEAADTLRQTFSVPIVAMEPGIKPAVSATKTGKVAVLATEKTLRGARLENLVTRFAGPERGVSVVTQGCPGWVEAVETGAWDARETFHLVARVVEPLIASGVDTLVLGCTHYPFLRPLIEQASGPNVTLIDTGPAVARQVGRVLHPETSSETQGITKQTANESVNTTPGNAPVDAFVTGDRACADFLMRRALGAGAPLTVRSLHWNQGELTDATK